MAIKVYSITEDDLAALECELPMLMSGSLMQCNDTVTRKRWEAVRDIVTRIRWDYGPPTFVEESEIDDPGKEGEEWKE